MLPFSAFTSPNWLPHSMQFKQEFFKGCTLIFQLVTKLKETSSFLHNTTAHQSGAETAWGQSGAPTLRYLIQLRCIPVLPEYRGTTRRRDPSSSGATQWSHLSLFTAASTPLRVNSDARPCRRGAGNSNCPPTPHHPIPVVVSRKKKKKTLNVLVCDYMIHPRHVHAV